jgi:hypothetical protein
MSQGHKRINAHGLHYQQESQRDVLERISDELRRREHVQQGLKLPRNICAFLINRSTVLKSVYCRVRRHFPARWILLEMSSIESPL